MKHWWIRLGCFLTGYNYDIVRNSSEISAKAVKRYTSAILIVCILWSFIGYTFTNRYLGGGTEASIAGALLFVVVIVQIERQIILSIDPSNWLYFSRVLIAVLMAFLGAVIIDQIIFKNDIELKQTKNLQEKVNDALADKTKQLNKQIADLDSTIFRKEMERQTLIKDVALKPTIPVYASETVLKTAKGTSKDPNTDNIVSTERSVVTKKSNVPNPKIELIAPLEETIKSLRNKKENMEKDLLNIRDTLEKEIKSKVGFLDEIEVMIIILTESLAAFVIWLVWFFFILGLELLVFFSKKNEKENDYERTVKHQMAIQNKKLDLLAKRSDHN